jgi:hypothetical protein
MRNLDIEDSRSKLDVYRNAGTLTGAGLMELNGSPVDGQIDGGTADGSASSEE